MSNILSVANALEKNRLESGTPYLVALDVEVVDPKTGVVVEPLHFVRNDEDIQYMGVPYVAAMFDIKFSAEVGAQNDVTLEIQDVTGTLQAYMEEYGGGVGFNVTMMVLNGDMLDKPAEIMEFFQITVASAQDYTATFTLGSENEVIKTFPRRRQTRDFCQWRYKDPLTCRYVGSNQSCDLTLQGPNGCQAHNNAINFGAYPGLNSNGYRYG